MWKKCGSEWKCMNPSCYSIVAYNKVWVLLSSVLTTKEPKLYINKIFAGLLNSVSRGFSADFTNETL